MLEPRTTDILDTSPSGIADLLDGLVDAHLEPDREVAAILATARESLRTLAWNRYAREVNRRSRAHVLRRRHQGRLPTAAEVPHA